HAPAGEGEGDAVPHTQAGGARLRMGLSHRRCPVLRPAATASAGTPARVADSRGGSVHTVLRAAARCEPRYQSIRQTVGQSEWVVPDETGWRVGGNSAWLHTLVGPAATAYVIDPTRSGAVAEAILGRDYDGILIHDGWSPYDQFQDARHQQCLQ